MSHLFITVLHSLTLACRAHKQELNTLNLELNGYGRSPIAALTNLIFPIVYQFQENIITYFSGPATVRAPQKRQFKKQRITPKAMPSGQKDAEEGWEGYRKTPTPASQTNECHKSD